MRFLCGITVLGLLLSGFARAQDYSKVLKTVSALQSVPKKLEATTLSCRTEEKGDPKFYFGKDAIRSQTIDCSALDPQLFCETVANACHVLHQIDPSIAGLSYGCVMDVVHSEEQGAREKNSNLKKRILDYAQTRFNAYTHDQELQLRCCGSNESCKKNFSEVNLKIIAEEKKEVAPGVFETEQKLYYNSVTNAVVVNADYLVDFMNEEGIESYFLHELGHACQTSLGNIRGLIGAGIFSIFGDAERGYDSALKPSLSQCLLSAIDAEAEAHREHVNEMRAQGKNPEHYIDDFGGFSLFSWKQEVFADTVFAFKLNSIFHYTKICNARGDHDHPKGQAYMQCLLEDAEIKKVLCSPQMH